MATGSLLKATKAKVGGIAAAVLGFVAPGATYLLTVDGDGISATEWQHALLIAVVAAAGTGGVVGGLVYAIENKPKPGVLLGKARYVGEPETDEHY